VLSARKHKLRLTVTEVDPELAMQADHHVVATIISNLLQNAFKDTRPHTHIRLHTHATADRVLFEIEDQCGGISPAKSEQLCEQLTRESDDSTGLALCVRGVNLLRGTIRIRNQNHGCVFTVDLPRLLS
jgi:signal transduction histidine kinase